MSKRLVDFAASEAILEYNFGNKAQSILMKASKVSPGKLSDRIMEIKDRRRVFQSKKRLTLKYKKYRQQKKLKKLKTEERKLKKEGVTYGAGLF